MLRRIIRRAIRFGQVLGMNDPFLHLVADRVIDLMGQDYRELVDSRNFIKGLVQNEEKRFADTLHYSMKVLQEQVEEIKAQVPWALKTADPLEITRLPSEEEVRIIRGFAPEISVGRSLSVELLTRRVLKVLSRAKES